MESQFRFVLLILVGSFLCSSSQAYKFFVGGKDGWVLNPSENYIHWAERMRFQVNDTLIFKYKKGSDSVLIVTKENYDQCNTKNPMQTLEDGDSKFKFDHSGPFFFISGNEYNCQKGQKIIIVVLAVRHHPAPISPAAVSPSPITGDAPAPSDHSDDVSDSPAPAPAPEPKKSSSPAFTRPAVEVVWGLSVVVSVVLGSFVGLF